MKKTRFSFAIILVAIVTTGCKPYDQPEFVEIDTSETGFLIPLEGKTDSQTTFESERYLNRFFGRSATPRV